MPETTCAQRALGSLRQETARQTLRRWLPESDEGISPEPGQALAPLALDADGCPEQQLNQKIECCMFDAPEHDTLASRRVFEAEGPGRLVVGEQLGIAGQ
jgi:hypothetical protein